MSQINPRVTAAAARLALFYTAFVVLEVLVLLIALGRDGWSLLPALPVATLYVATPFFLAAFILLVVARRFGLVVSWLVFLGLWIVLVFYTGIGMSPLEFPLFFLLWSILALPLWVIGQLGISSKMSFRIGAARVSPSAAFLTGWALLLVGVRLYLPIRESLVISSRPLATLLAWMWGLAPVALSLFAIRHVWRGTGKATASAIEQKPALG